MKVTVHLKEGVEYPGGSTNAVKMYVTYEGQGEKNAGNRIVLQYEDKSKLIW